MMTLARPCIVRLIFSVSRNYFGEERKTRGAEFTLCSHCQEIIRIRLEVLYDKTLFSERRTLG